MDPPRRYFVTAVITNTVHLAISSDVVIHFIHPILQSTSTLGVVLEMAYGPDRLDHENEVSDLRPSCVLNGIVVYVLGMQRSICTGQWYNSRVKNS